LKFSWWHNLVEEHGEFNEERFHQNPLAVLDFTIIGSFALPGLTISAEGKAAGALVDVDTGAIRFLINAEQRKSGKAPGYFADGKVNSIQAGLRNDLIARLTDEFIHKLRAE